VPTVSFLFVDQVGSTAQLQALGDEGAAPVRRALFDIIQSALVAHGGTLVDNTGDGVLATFDGAVAAVDCAAGIQRGAARHNRRSAGAESIEVRAGVHVGEPVTDETGRHFGMAVVVAARLCAAAEGGQVLVSDLVRALCASRGHLAFSPVGSLELKGAPGRPGFGGSALSSTRWASARDRVSGGEHPLAQPRGDVGATRAGAPCAGGRQS
jgi:adenylate cyclase